MTVTNTVPVSGPHVADGTNRDWQFTFKVDNVAHMALRITDADGSNEQIITTDFTIAANYLDNNSGGYVNYPTSPVAPLLAGKLIYPYRVVPYEQPTQIGNQGGFFPKTHERAFDYIDMQVQQLAEGLSRALQSPFGVAGYVLPLALAGAVLGWNAAGTALENKTLVSLGAAVVIDDPLLAGNSHVNVPSQYSVKSYVDTAFTTKALNQATTGFFWAEDGARIHRMNDRIFLGAATVNDGRLVNVTEDWLSLAMKVGRGPAFQTTNTAQLASISSIGQIAVLGGSRASDIGLTTGTIGGAFFAVNDQTSYASGVYGIYAEAHREATVTGTAQVYEGDIINKGSVASANPYAMFPAGLTSNLWVASGGGHSAATTASLAIGILNNGARYDKGIVFHATALLGTDGTGTGTGIAIQMARDQKIQWAKQNATAAADIYSDVTNGGPYQLIAFTDIGTLFRNTNAKNLLRIDAADNFVNGFALFPKITGAAPLLQVQGDDTNIGMGIATKGTGVYDFYTNTNIRQMQVAHVATAVNYLQLKGAATAGSPQLSALGSDTNVNLGFATQGTGLFDFFTAGSVRQFRIYDTPSAVNYIQLSGSATGAATTLASVGADTNVNMVVSTKGSGSVFLNSNGTIVAEFQNPASVVNRLLLQGAVTTGSPIIVATGTDTNIGGILRGRGAGGFDLQDGGSVSKFKYTSTTIGFFNATPVVKQTVGAALSTGGAETNVNLATRINDLRTALINYGLAA